MAATAAAAAVLRGSVSERVSECEGKRQAKRGSKPAPRFSHSFSPPLARLSLLPLHSLSLSRRLSRVSPLITLCASLPLLLQPRLLTTTRGYQPLALSLSVSLTVFSLCRLRLCLRLSLSVCPSVCLCPSSGSAFTRRGNSFLLLLTDSRSLSLSPLNQPLPLPRNLAFLSLRRRRCALPPATSVVVAGVVSSTPRLSSLLQGSFRPH